MEQITLFNDSDSAPVNERVTWNLWHGCTKVSEGCRNCYMFRHDYEIGGDPTNLHRTRNFNLPILTFLKGKHKGEYKIPSKTCIYTCFSSDFFHPNADRWRDEAWGIIKQRSDCTFYMITKRPERILENLPTDWKDNFSHVTIAVTCENQTETDKRLPIYLELPLFNHSIVIEPMLESVNLQRYFKEYPNKIKSVTVGGESGTYARPCNYDWVLDVRNQCIENNASFFYHQTGSVFIKDNKRYSISKRYIGEEQAHKAGIDITY